MARNRPDPEKRLTRGRARVEASFPVAPSRAGLPADYAAALAAIKARIAEERVRVVLSANAAMVLLYWDVGRMILDRQDRAGWGAKVVDRLSADLREAFPEMRGFSPRNLKYMRAFAAAWPEPAIVQRVVAQLPWRQNLALLERLDDPGTRLPLRRSLVICAFSQRTRRRTASTARAGNRCRTRSARSSCAQAGESAFRAHESALSLLAVLLPVRIREELLRAGTGAEFDQLSVQDERFPVLVRVGGFAADLARTRSRLERRERCLHVAGKRVRLWLAVRAFAPAHVQH